MVLGGERARHGFLQAGHAALAMLADDELAERWEEPSALAHWRTAGLAGHLARGVLTVTRYLDAEPAPPGVGLVDAPAYLLTALDDDGLDVEGELARAIRERGEETADAGARALRAQTADALRSLRSRLGPGAGRVPGARRLQVLDGIAITLDDYLATRVVELVVHTDDLATSLGRAPRLPPAALALAADVVVEVARRRRGDLTVLRALARRERVPAGPLAL